MAFDDTTGRQRLSSQKQLFRDTLRSFSHSDALTADQLSQLSPREWRHLLDWLDLSGLALYFLDRAEQIELLPAFPSAALERLQENLRNNTQRTRGMIAESVAIQRGFQDFDVHYAVMKGISFTPVSVPRPELRHQFDLDYLVHEASAPQARQVLERRGYRLNAISGKTWEFKIHETPYVSRKDLYKDLPYRSVELHLESENDEQQSRLDRLVHREMYGLTMPVLSPVDLFLGQALHAFKDVCSAFSRAAHLLEFYRHVLAHYDEEQFWSELRERTACDPAICFRVGVVTYLMTLIMGDFAPHTLTSWAVERLPASTRLWIHLYGQHTVFSKDPGTKLYLLLQKELEAIDVSKRKPLKTLLWPSRLPPPVIRGTAGESLHTKLARYRIQIRYVLSRLRFHLVEGSRYAVESYRWHQHLDRLS